MRLRNPTREAIECAVCGFRLRPGADECPSFNKPVECGLSPLVEEDRPAGSKPRPVNRDEALAKLSELAGMSPHAETRLTVPEGYADLFEVLMSAFAQSATGKGRERHNRTGGLPFNKQPIMEIGRMVGPGYASGQAMKKLQEALRLPRDRAIAECYGAIVYAAAMVLLLREQEQDK